VDVDATFDKMSTCVAVLGCENAALEEFNVCVRVVLEPVGFEFGQYATGGYFMSGSGGE